MLVFGSVTVTNFLLSVLLIFHLQLKCIDGLSSIQQVEQQRQQLQQQEKQQQHLQLQTHSEQKQSTTSLDVRNFLVGIARIGALHERTTQCGHELEQLLTAIDRKQLWVQKVLDSFGVAPHSFLWGNYFWFGAQYLCLELNDPYRITFSKKYTGQHDFNITSPFPVEFFMIYANFQTPHFIDLKLPFKYLLHLGLCLPRTCSPNDIFNYTNLYFRDGKFETQQNFQLQLQPVDMRQPQFRWSFFRQTGSIIFMLICISVVSLVIVAEIVHKSKKRLQAQQQMHMKQNLGTETEVKHSTSVATYEKILNCFRLMENYRRATELNRKTGNTENFLSAIAGLRVIICLWVTVFHVYYYSLYAMSNAPLIFAKLEHFALQPIMQACFYVDVFFVMSAFLLVYNFLQNERQMKQIKGNNRVQNLKLYGKAVIHRYLRLTPVMIVTMLLSDMVFDFLNMYSPFRLGENSGIYCKRNWWLNLFYLHNLVDMKDICCSWTWYLACEMQFFLLFTALLFLYAKRPQATTIIFVVLSTIFVVISWLCNYFNGISFQIDVIHTTLDELYVKPWVRINPYIGGSIAGWLLHHLQQRENQKQQKHLPHQHQHQLVTGTSSSSSSSSTTPSLSVHFDRVHRFLLRLFWFSCIALYVVTNFMSYFRMAPAWLVAAIMSFGKLIFALHIGGIIILCASGHGGVLQKFLSMRALQFLNRFCFSIYMLAPVIVIAVFGLRGEPTSFTEVGSGLDFFALLTFSIAAAFLLVLLIELPMQRISNLLLRTKWN